MKTGRSNLIVSAVLAAGLLIASIGIAQAAPHAFLRLDGISGGSQDVNHIGWMDVSINTAANIGAQLSFVSGSGTPVSKTTAAPLDFTKLQDTATPGLFFDCAKGLIIATGTLDITPDNTADSILRLELSNINVTSMKEGSGLASPGAVTDQFQLSALVTQWNYAIYDGNSGLPIYINNLLDLNKIHFTAATNQPVFSMSGIRVASGVELNWTGVKGQTYRVYSVNHLGTPFVPVAEKTATNNGAMLFDLPAASDSMFYLIEKTP